MIVNVVKDKEKDTGITLLTEKAGEETTTETEKIGGAQGCTKSKVPRHKNRGTCVHCALENPNSVCKACC